VVSVRAHEIGARYERSLSAEQRRAGAHYTPPRLAQALTRLAVDRWSERGPRRVPLIADPTCGAGSFLLAALDELVEVGANSVEALERVRGVDLDSGAIDAARVALFEWWRHREGSVPTGERSVRAIIDRAVTVQDGFDLLEQLSGCVDIIVGNPPFQNQLQSASARSVTGRRSMQARFGEAAIGYVDDAALFLLAAVGHVASGGVVTMIQPRSTLAASHARGVRQSVLERGQLIDLWIDDRNEFGASVSVCAPVISVGPSSVGPTMATTLHHGRVQLDSERRCPAPRSTDDSWSSCVASTHGVPKVELGTGSTIGDHSNVTAGFRDQYYGLVGHVSDARPSGAAARLITTGAIDIGGHGWGVRTQRFAKSSWTTPWVDVDAARADTPALTSWFELMARPKVLVATQTRVAEAMADPMGDFVGATPIIAAVPKDPSMVPSLAAVISSPPVAAWLAHRCAGSGMSRTSYRFRASDIAAIVIPPDMPTWDEAVVAFEAHEWTRFANLSCGAYGIASASAVDVTRWWLDEIPD